MTIDLSSLKADPTVDIQQLERQIEQCHHPGDYMLHLTDDEGYARVGLLQLSAHGEGRASERFPVHGVGKWFRGCNDSYDGLISILEQGFSAWYEGDLNAAIHVEEFSESLVALASGRQQSDYAKESRRPETQGDRYFLEFKRFSQEHFWRAYKPVAFILDQIYISMQDVQASDMRVNVILGTTDPSEVRQRIHSYQESFIPCEAESRFANTNGLIHLE